MDEFDEIKTAMDESGISDEDIAHYVEAQNREREPIESTIIKIQQAMICSPLLKTFIEDMVREVTKN